MVTSDEPSDLAAGTAAARRLGIPLFVDGPGLADELDRLGTRTVLRWSATAPPASPSPSSGALATGAREVIAATDVDDLPELPGLPLQPPRNAPPCCCARVRRCRPAWRPRSPPWGPTG